MYILFFFSSFLFLSNKVKIRPNQVFFLVFGKWQGRYREQLCLLGYTQTTGKYMEYEANTRDSNIEHLISSYLSKNNNSVKNKGKKKLNCDFLCSMFLTFGASLRPYFLTDLDGNCIISFGKSLPRACPCYFFRFLSTFLI